MRTINYLINVYSVTFWGLYYWLFHSFFVFWVRYWQCNVCGCLSFELVMMKVVVYNAFIVKP